MDYFKNIILFKYRRYGKKIPSFHVCSPIRFSQTEILASQTYPGARTDDQFSTLSYRRPWVKVGSVLALAGYTGQLACQFLACSLLWAGRPLEAMEAVGKPSETVSFSCQLPVDDADHEAEHQPPIHRPLDQIPDSRREALLQNIITVTDAEYDWPCHVTATLQQALCNLQSGNLKDCLTRLAGQIKQPEDLLYFGPLESETILYRRGITSKHSVFKTFQSLRKLIKNIMPDVDKPLQNDLKGLKDFYGSYIGSLCQCNNDPNRQDGNLENIFAKKALLKIEGPVKGYPFPSPSNAFSSSASFGFFRISQEAARQLISKNKHGVDITGFTP